MKNFSFKQYFAVLIACFAIGCTDVLDKKNLENLVADDLWVDPVLLKGFMDNVMRDNLPGQQEMTYITDESYGQYDIGLPYDNIPISQESGSNLGIGYVEQWNYGAIRNINMFIDNVHKCPETKLPLATRNDYLAQMKVLRAWKYFQMVRLYGGVPLLLHAQNASDDLNVPREKTSVCMAQIIQDMDEAIAMGEDFPMKRDADNAGRISRSGALAMKGRMMLYYASPQFSKQTPAGTKDAATRWQEAYAANKTAAEQLTAAGYGLFRPNPASHAEAVQNCKDMFAEEYETNNPEMVWVQKYQYPQRTSFTGAVRTSVTLELANAYANADGSPYTGIIIPAAGAPGIALEIANVPFWQGREPRFYATMLYNGKEHRIYRNGASTVLPNDMADGKLIHWWMFQGGANNPYNNCDRLDNLGMYHIKMCDQNINETVSNGNQSGVDYPIIRYAEVLLNLAECAAKTNREPEALDILKQIRRRAGIPQGTNNYGLGNPSGDALILAILNERRVELATEGFRFWDTRRWRLFTDPLAGYKINGLVRHTLKAKPKMAVTDLPTVLHTIDIDNDPDSYFAVFDNEIHAMDSNPFNVGERQYFYRIAYEQHIKKNPQLQQTLLWDDGIFNPYE